AVSGDGGAGGTLDVSLEGTAYPLRLTRAGDAGELRMRDWNEKFTLPARCRSPSAGSGGGRRHAALPRRVRRCSRGTCCG
ncbi:hypothetical protein CWI85_38340, partial [Streptomyces albidoflavus]